MLSDMGEGNRQLIDGVKSHIFNKIRELARERVSSRTWTDRIKDRLHSLANELKLDCRHSPTRESGEINWEFLCDLVLLDTESHGARHEHGYFEPGFRIRKCIMACEIEWGLNRDKDLLYDFSKLLLIRADLAVFVCETENERSFTDLCKKLEDAAKVAGIELAPTFLIVAHVRDRGERPDPALHHTF